MRNIDLNGKTILVTGSPGFIGANLVLRLLREMDGGTVVSLDNMNDYYDPALKEYRLGLIRAAEKDSGVRHVFVKGAVEDAAAVEDLFGEYRFDVVVHLAAQAGVRYSIDHPDVYIRSNLVGFYSMLEACRRHPPEHFVYASSSSVYGGNRKVPFSTEDRVDRPVSLYAATKKSDELLAHAYAELFGIPSTGLRFFTVYGPAGRPDMFYYSAAETLARGGTIRIFNHGNMRRDFTYVDDIVEGVVRVMRGAPEKRRLPDGTEENEDNADRPEHAYAVSMEGLTGAIQLNSFDNRGMWAGMLVSSANPETSLYVLDKLYDQLRPAETEAE